MLHRASYLKRTLMIPAVDCQAREAALPKPTAMHGVPGAAPLSCTRASAYADVHSDINEARSFYGLE